MRLYRKNQKPAPVAKPKAVRGSPEEDLQRAVVEFLKLAMPSCDDGIVWSATLNGVRVVKSIRQKLKALGTNAGVVLDLCFIDMREGSVTRGQTFWIELKSAKGRATSETQGRVVDVLASVGRGCYCRSVDEVEAALKGWGFPVRGRVQ